MLLLAPQPAFAAVKTYAFRPASWDLGQHGAHLGTAIEQEHPAMRGMPCKGWCDLQFFGLVQGSAMISLDELPVKIRPIIRSIGLAHRISNQAYLFEVAVGKGKLLVSGLNFAIALGADDQAVLTLGAGKNGPSRKPSTHRSAASRSLPGAGKNRRSLRTRWGLTIPGACTFSTSSFAMPWEASSRREWFLTLTTSRAS